MSHENRACAILENEERFFEIVQTTPDIIEANWMVRDAIASIKLEMGDAALMCSVVGNARVTQLSGLRDKLKSELHRLVQIEQSVSWQKAIRAVCGDDAFKECVIWIRAMGGTI